MRWASRVAATVIVASFSLAGTAAAQESLKGVALVIGQSEYAEGSGMRPLRNPENDARALDDLLDDLGFDVDRVLDADAEELAEALTEFAEDAAGADVALVYYSGHGIEAGGTNYLIPVDADMSTPRSAGQSLVPLQDVLAELQRTVKVTIFLVDACRTSSFSPGQLIQLPGEAAPVAVSPEGLGPEATRGELLVASGAGADSLGAVIGFASSPGQAALDGEGDNSPYAAALIKHLGAGGYGLMDIMTLVTNEVFLETSSRQLPWTNASLTQFVTIGTPVEETGTDDATIREGRRSLLMGISETPPAARELVVALAGEQEVPLDALFGMLQSLGVDTSDPNADLSQQIEDGAARLREYLERPYDAAITDPELSRLAGLIDQAIAEGAIQVAKAFGAQLIERASNFGEALNEARIEAASALAKGADAMELAFDFAAAADAYGKAFDQVNGLDAELTFTYKNREADALMDHGSYRGDTDALFAAIAAYEDALAMASRETAPRRWTAVQNNIGTVYSELSERLTDPAMLEKATAAYRAVLDVRTVESDPDGWASVTYNLALLLMTQGERETGTAKLEEAEALLKQSIEIFTREAAPRDWALTQTTLAIVARTLGERERKLSRLEDAIAAYHAALEVFTRDAAPIDWAATTNSLGNTLVRLGDLRDDPVLLEEAVVAFNGVLEVYTRDRMPLLWASTQANLGNTLRSLAGLTGDVTRYEQSVAAYRAAMEEMSRERSPIAWATMNANLGTLLTEMGLGSGDARFLDEAADAYRAALTVRTREELPVDWADTQNGLGNTLTGLALLRADQALLEEAIMAFRNALQVLTRGEKPLEWAGTQSSLGLALRNLAEGRGDAGLMGEAAEAYRRVMEVRTQDENPVGWARAADELSKILALGGSLEALDESRALLVGAQEIYAAVGYEVPNYAHRLADVEARLAELK